MKNNMAGRVKVVVLNHKSELIGFFDSLNDLAVKGGFPKSSVSHAYRLRRIYRCMLIISEEEYFERYMNGTIEELKFKTKKERNLEKGLRIKQSMTKESIIERNRKISESRKREIKEGKNIPIQKAVEARRKPIMCVETGQSYISVVEASRDLGISDSYISSVAKGRRRTAHGLTFRYI